MMRTKTGPNGSADKHIKEIKRKTRRKFSAEEKIRIGLAHEKWRDFLITFNVTGGPDGQERATYIYRRIQARSCAPKRRKKARAEREP